MKTKMRVALVTGSDRGIGYETCRGLARRGFAVTLTSPDLAKARAAAKKLGAEGLRVVPRQLDVAGDASVKAIAKFIAGYFGRLDVLVNNAGVMLDIGHSRLEGSLAGRYKKVPGRTDYGEGKRLLDADIGLIRATFEINTLGALRTSQACIPLMKKNGYGRVVNVSSRLGQLQSMSDEDTVPAYQLSKAALNAVTLMLADDCRGSGVAVNSVCPGWTHTQLGGEGAPQSAGEATDTILWLATQPHAEPTAGFYFQKKRIPW